MSESLYNGLRLVRRLLILALALAVILLITSFFVGFSYDTFARGAYNILHAVTSKASADNVVFLSADEYADVALFKDGPVRVTHTLVNTYSPSLVVYSSHPVTLRSPAECHAGDTMLIYDRGGTSAYVFDSFDLLYTLSLDDTVCNGAVSEDGRVCLVTSKEGYRGSVTVFKRDGKGRVMTWNCADSYLFDAVFSGDDLFVVGYRPDRESTDTVVYRLDGKTGDVLSFTVIEDEMPFCMAGLRGGSLAVACTYGVYTVHEGLARLVYDYRGGIPTEIRMTADRLVFTSESGIMTVFDGSGSLLFESAFDRIVDITVCGENILVLTPGTLFVLDETGAAVSEMSTDSSVRRILTDGTHSFAVCTREIRQIEIPFNTK